MKKKRKTTNTHGTRVIRSVPLRTTRSFLLKKNYLKQNMEETTVHENRVSPHWWILNLNQVTLTKGWNLDPNQAPPNISAEHETWRMNEGGLKAIMSHRLFHLRQDLNSDLHRKKSSQQE